MKLASGLLSVITGGLITSSAALGAAHGLAGCAGASYPSDGGRVTYVRADNEWHEIVPWENARVAASDGYGSQCSGMDQRFETKVEYEIEPGKSLDLFFLDLEQVARSRAGNNDMTQRGRDFIETKKNAVGSGFASKVLDGGRYCFVYHNTGDSEIVVRTRVLGRALD